MKKLYYTVEKELDGSESLNGLKTISVYEMIDNEPKMLTIIDAVLEDNSEEKIQEYLDDNGMGDDKFTFKLL